jgi:hypothetical protein
MVVGDRLGLELAQSSLDLCGIEFHGAVLSFGFALSKKPRVIGFCGASHVVVVEARRARKKPRKPSPRMVKRASAAA